jgi:hypothetical protein
MSDNPFSVTTPEEMTAKQANQLFVEMYSDYPQIGRPGNLLMTGARGTGKSMLIRCSLPDVMMIKDSKSFSELDYVAFHIPVKKTSLNLTELKMLEKHHAPYLINEHFLTLNVLLFSLLELSKFTIEDYSEKAYRDFFNVYCRYLKLSGCEDEIDASFETSNTFFTSLYQHAEQLQAEFIGYLSGLSLNPDSLDSRYNLPLFSYLRFVVPVFRKLMELPGFPIKKYIYIFIDDADNLSHTQTEILNTWLACRTQPSISLKVSAQYEQYKTYLSSSGILVEAPHDYQEINISYKYTTAGKGYYEKACEILGKRLKMVGIEISPEDYFPSYRKQEDGINEEKEKLKAEYDKHGRGYSANDDMRRYAIPNYIKGLGGVSKSRMTYRYAGLKNIIHLSSGVIRYLLDAAAEMYDEEHSSQENIGQVTFISTEIQDRVMREQAERFLFSELRKLTPKDKEEPSPSDAISEPRNDAEKLQNLLLAMGKTFSEILLSERSERKVFSIAFSNTPDAEIKRVMQLGVRLGFLHEARIGNKEGNGRTWLYIMNRCFAPLFTLDPTGFQGYFFITNDDLHRAMKNGKRLRALNEIDTAPEEALQLSFEDLLDSKGTHNDW